MEKNLNTSQLVKTYGKPRHTQALSRNSLWNDNLADKFDKCMGIEDDHQTTFMSPESTSSVSMKKNNHTEYGIATNTISGWSKHLQSTLTGHKSISKHKR